MKLSGHNWIGPQADRVCAESLRLSGKHLKSLSFCCFFLLPAGAGKAEPFRTAGGKAAIFAPSQTFARTLNPWQQEVQRSSAEGDRQYYFGRRER